MHTHTHTASSECVSPGRPRTDSVQGRPTSGPPACIEQASEPRISLLCPLSLHACKSLAVLADELMPCAYMQGASLATQSTWRLRGPMVWAYGRTAGHGVWASVARGRQGGRAPERDGRVQYAQSGGRYDFPHDALPRPPLETRLRARGNVHDTLLDGTPAPACARQC